VDAPEPPWCAKVEVLNCTTEASMEEVSTIGVDLAKSVFQIIRIRQNAYLNNRIEQDHRAIRRRARPMLGFQTMATARAILGGIEMLAAREITRDPALGPMEERAEVPVSPWPPDLITVAFEDAEAGAATQ
jgi:hypothetical protein